MGVTRTIVLLFTFIALRKSPCSVDVIEDEISSVTPTQQSKLRGRQSDRKKEREIMLRGRKEERASDREIKQRGRGEIRAVLLVLSERVIEKK